jgi:hypothetical protein
MSAEQWITLAWTAITILALGLGYAMGWARGNKSCNDWWNQYGAQVFAYKGAVIYGTALYKAPQSDAAGKIDADQAGK